MSASQLNNPSLSRRDFFKGVGVLGGAAALTAAGSIVPSRAFADGGPEIEAKYPSMTLKAGQQVDGEKVAGWFSVQGSEAGYHRDYKIESNTAGSVVAQVVKHTGVLTALSAGTATLTCYLTPGEKKDGVKDNPCSPTGISASMTIVVEGSSDYGFQGDTNAIMMTDPKPISTTGDFESGYTNQLGALTAQDGWYYFTLQMTNGFRDWNGAAKFAERNAGFIRARNEWSAPVATLNEQNTGNIQIVSAVHNTRTFVVRIAASVIGARGALEFLKPFRGNNADNSLGTTVLFQFSA